MESMRVRDVSFSNGTVELAGSLSVPVGTDLVVAGVVLVGGSGPTGRDNGTYFPPLRQHFVKAGFAVLSYDKRGVGQSTGDWHTATMDDLAADAVTALNFLRAQPEVPSQAAGLFGHSEGGWVALRASAAQDDLPWVVTNSCPGTSPAEQERYALANHLRGLHGDGHPEFHSTLSLYDQLTEAGRRDADFATAQQLVDDAGAPPGLAYYWGNVDERLWRFLKRKQDHDPIPDLLRLRCPHLALFGGADKAVPVADSIRVFAEAACDAARPHRATLTVEVFPGGDHRLQVQGSTDLAPGYLDRVSRWLAHHVTTPTDGGS
ncbi:alpha/beta hydrolase [Streptomyces sp. AC563]|uniref:alpha/beta hydrolase family protein n=1 Tax=Streptomyces buecherae TaxID=2763006 RepID=UPI00164D67F8|nr:alpha/beta hydrolase [Streptomyces buecherae]MBC3992022.1 alpha/beta hydrolase [Streptomyces buecherae]